MTRGVPQGSSLSALLFLIYVNDIFELPLRGHLQLYADDAILIYSESNYDELQRHMREDLLKIYNWFYNNLLSFNVSKTKYVIFNPKNKDIPPT
jgi:Reverse transcriptase (RNA-dependent DNA polymerase)